MEKKSRKEGKLLILGREGKIAKTMPWARWGKKKKNLVYKWRDFSLLGA